jgi:signal transduction histidine kinase
MTQSDQKTKNVKNVAFKISSRTARMIGRQNVSNQFIALIELIKNAYDADSPRITLEFKREGDSFGSIILQDWGTGMDADAVENRWLMLGTDFKEREPVSKKGRVRAGAKGIGRFALDRLGELGELETFQSEDADGLRLAIDWSKYDDPNTSFASITHVLETIPNAERQQGTRIVISKLRDHWTDEDFRILHEDLAFLVPPLESFETAFSIELIVEGRDDLSGTIEPLIREAAEYELHSSILSDGTVEHILKHHTGERTVGVYSWEEVSPQAATPLFKGLLPDCGPLKAVVLFYVRDNSVGKGLGFDVTKLRRYLKTFGGIRIYRDGFQIKPYGSRGNDWLSLDDRKTRSPEGVGQELGSYKVSNGQLVGTVIVSRLTNPHLEDQTNREGLIANAALVNLKAFLLHGISFLELQRQRRYQRDQVITPPSDPIARTADTVKALVADIKRSNKKNISASIDPPKDKLPKIVSSKDEPDSNQVHVTESQLDDLTAQADALVASAEAAVQELQLLRALATLGLAMTTFAHEIQANVVGVQNGAARLSIEFKKNPSLSLEIRSQLQRILDNVERIDGWSNFILERVKKTQRHQQEISFQDVAATIFSSMGKTFERRGISLDQDFDPNTPRFFAFPIDVEAILMNLITNSVKALERVPLESRTIKVSSVYKDKVLVVHFDDSGPGINLADLPSSLDGVDQIFHPFVTRSDGDGTGMGLAVVSKIVEDYKGTITVDSKGLLGGASFTLKLPLQFVGRTS